MHLVTAKAGGGQFRKPGDHSIGRDRIEMGYRDMERGAPGKEAAGRADQMTMGVDQNVHAGG
jgi:hypothetical protein